MNFDIGKFQQGMNAASGGAGLLAGTIQRGMEMADLPENDIQEKIDDLNAQTYNVGSYNELMNKFNSTNWMKTNYNLWDLTGMSKGEAAGKIALNALQGGAEGAKFGLQVGGPWGALIGAAVGTTADALGSGFGWMARKNKARTAAAQYNHEGEIANELALNGMQNNAINIGKDNHNLGLLYRAAEGGPLYINDVFTNGITKIENGGTHEQNPLGGVPMGIAADGLQNLVEEGELIYKDYVFSKRLQVPEASKALLGLSKKKDYTFADAAEQIQKESEERPNDIISERNLNEMMARLQETQETVKAKKEARRLRSAYNKLSPLDKMNLAYAMQQPQGQVGFASGGHLHAFGDKLYKFENDGSINLNPESDWGNIFYNNLNAEQQNEVTEKLLKIKQNDANIEDTLDSIFEPYTNKVVEQPQQQRQAIGNPWAQTLRNMSVYGALAGAIGSLFDKPNYSNIARAENAMASVPRVSAGHVGQRMVFNPFDINYLMAQTANQGIGTRRALVESGAGPQALIASNYGTQTAMGQNLLAALKENDARRLQALEFNRGTDATNIGNDLSAALANQRRDMMGANFLLETGQLRDRELATVQNNRSLQWTNAFNQMHNLGTDMLNREAVAANANSGVWGVLNEYMKQLQRTQGTAAFGGKLNKKGGKHA